MKRNKIKQSQLVLISKNLSQLYKDGIPMSESLELVRDTVTNKQYKESLRKVVLYTKEGRGISESFREFDTLYPPFFTGLISIGENTGKLYEVLNGVGNFYEKYLSITGEVKNACIYPAFIFVSLIVMLIFLINIIIPSFYEMYNSMNINPPDVCIILYSIYMKSQNDFVVFIMTIGSWLISSVIIFSLLVENIKWKFFYKINIVRNFIEYMTVLLFALICSTGINISDALKYCDGSIRPKYLNDKLKEINNDIMKGLGLTEALKKSNILSKGTLAVIRIREESGSVSRGFEELSRNLEKSLVKKIKKYLAALNPIFISIMSILILLFVVFFIVPIFSNIQVGLMK